MAVQACRQAFNFGSTNTYVGGNILLWAYQITSIGSGTSLASISLPQILPPCPPPCPSSAHFPSSQPQAKPCTHTPPTSLLIISCMLGLEPHCSNLVLELLHRIINQSLGASSARRADRIICHKSRDRSRIWPECALDQIHRACDSRRHRCFLAVGERIHFWTRS